MARSAAVVLAVGLLLSAASALSQTKTVGTFDRQAIVVAFYRSPTWAETLKARRLALQRAIDARDPAKARELEQWGEDAQELAHRQLAGDAPIANVLEALKPAFDQIRKSVGVSDVIAAPAPDMTIRTVDVTERLLAWLKADENTRKAIADLQHHVER